MLTRLPSDYLRILYNADPGGGGGAPGGDGGTGGGAPAGGAPAGGAPAGGGGDEPKFTQAEVDRLMGRTRSEARTAAVNELATELGVTVDEAKAIIAAKNQADEETKSEAQKALDAANRAKAEADQAKAEAAKERFDAKVERALLKAGVTDAALTRAARMVALPADADDDAITAEIDAIKADVPSLFTPPAGGTPPPPAAGGTPPPASSPAGGQGTVTGLDRGAEIAAKRHPRPAA